MYTQQQAHYTDRGTKAEHCEICEHYVNPTTCRIVSGEIRSYGWCEHFKLAQRYAY